MNKKFIFAAFAAVGTFSLAACNSTETKSTVSKTDTIVNNVASSVQTAVNDVKQTISPNEDSNFIMKAAVANNTELRVLQAGIDKGTSSELKAHAKMMLADHKKLKQSVKDYADKKGWVLPDADKADDALATINGYAQGNDWDKAWVNHMIDAHKDAISMFEKGSANATDPNLKSLIDFTLPTLRSHLDMMKALQDKMSQ